MKSKFIVRWKVDPDSGLYSNPDYPYIAQVVDADRREGTITIKIDLGQYSKKRIMREVEYIIDDWREDLKEELDDLHKCLEIGIYPHWWGVEDDNKTPRILEPPDIKEGKVRSDLDDYRKYFEVWMLRTVQKKSWSKIQPNVVLSIRYLDVHKAWRNRESQENN